VQQEIPTPRGTAHIRIEPAAGPLAVLVLGHGAGGTVDAPDLAATATLARAHGVTVVRVTQPYRVAGRRAPAPATHLDEAWLEVLRVLRTLPGLDGAPLVTGGRSSGARVACRTAVATAAAGVVALAFPLHPPGRPERSRAGELDTGVPTLVVNGDRDPFGVPAADGPATVRVVPGERHALSRDPVRVAGVVVEWLAGHGWARSGASG
jgi:predicted alpha/beta-hydrolase family hydrolase